MKEQNEQVLQHNMYHVILAIWTLQANRESHCFSSLSCSASRAWRRPDKSGKFSCSAGIGHLHVVDFRGFFLGFMHVHGFSMPMLDHGPYISNMFFQHQCTIHCTPCHVPLVLTALVPFPHLIWAGHFAYTCHVTYSNILQRDLFCDRDII
jgi:hypothetical protein